MGEAEPTSQGGKKVRIQHMHIPDVSIPDSERSHTESRAVAWRMKVGAKRVVLDVVTGDFTLHKTLAAQVSDVSGTRFELPKPVPYESAVLLGLLLEGEQVSVFATAHGSRPEARIGVEEAYAVLHSAAAGIAVALRRGYALDRAEPSDEPSDLDRFPEPARDAFDVTPEMVAEFDRDVLRGLVVLHEEISPSGPAPASQAPAPEEVLAIKRLSGPRRRSVLDFLKSYARRGDVFSDES